MKKKNNEHQTNQWQNSYGTNNQQTIHDLNSEQKINGIGAERKRMLRGRKKNTNYKPEIYTVKQTNEFN